MTAESECMTPFALGQHYHRFGVPISVIPPGLTPSEYEIFRSGWEAAETAALLPISAKPL